METDLNKKALYMYVHHQSMPHTDDDLGLKSYFTTRLIKFSTSTKLSKQNSFVNMHNKNIN